MSAHLEPQSEIAFIYIDNPPVNGLGHATRLAIQTHLRAALADSAIRAIVITGQASAFSGGADIKEFGTDKTFAEPSLPHVLGEIENASKPVIAAINGVCMGGGLELALACHYRIGMAGCPIALPEVKLGILPGAGGTQRLPRLVPIATCIEMISTGVVKDSSELRDCLLFDLFVEEGKSFRDEVKQYAIRIAADGKLTRVCDRQIVSEFDAELFAKCRAQLQKKNAHFPAPFKCLDVLEQSFRLSFEAGLQLERESFKELLASPESKALRHIFIAERAASKIDGIDANTKLRSIERVAIIGAGTMGSGIAMNFASAGIPVQILDQNSESLQRGLARIRSTYEASLSKGKLSFEQCQRACGLVQGVSDYDAIKDADLVIEAVFEQMSVKEDVFRTLDAVMKPGAILASNTSTLDLNHIALTTSRPTDVIGLHFFSPANIMELLEIVRGEATSPEVLATCAKLAKRIKKTAVVAGVCDGFIGNRMLAQYTKQAAFLLEEGCTPQQVDHAIEAFGFAMGPFRMSDLAGNDISWAVRKARKLSKPDEIYSELGDLLCEMGRFGQKTKAGWYDYNENDRTAYASTVVTDMIKQHAAVKAFAQRTISDEEIVERLVFALALEGRKILTERIAARSSDIDLVYLKGYGFPSHIGGPMFFAESKNWDYVERRISEFATGHRGELWHL